ncbi:MAG TPA: hypothetical protein VJ850_13980 [Candidatus Limnocylindrales bacterium]|nr:hypothetical protein [Candidatus Limnocylindrales bacterium]
MTRDPRAPRPPGPASLDDDAIGLLVRDVAAAWSLPPLRLDAPSWRDRVRDRRARLVDGVRFGIGHLGRAATAAVALTVVAALVAVVITRPPVQPGGSPGPSNGASTGGPSNRPSGAAAATGLPTITRDGELPYPSRIMVANESGDMNLVDLGFGTIGGAIARTQWPSAMTVTPDGLVVCVCISTSAQVDGYPTTFDVRLRTFTPTTTPIRDDPIDVLVGKADPRTPATHADHVWTQISFSPDVRYAFVGWSTRDTSVWHGGLLVVDIQSGAIVGSQDFPDMTAGDGDARRTVGAPRVLGIAAGTIYLARSWAEWASANTDVEPAHVGDDAYQATMSSGALSDLVPFSDAASCGPSFVRAGVRPGGGLWVSCLSQLGSLTVRRVGADGTSLGSESMARTGLVDGDTTAMSPDGRRFFAWDPGSSTLTRIDLETGERVNQRLGGAAVSSNAMTLFGRWLAPETDAKSILRGAILLSPDGGRVYLLATEPVVDERQPTGSDGVLVVDAATLKIVDHWPPQADLMSMALSFDGSLLYAAGMPGVDASGAPAAAQGASVTVYDTATGKIRLIAGQLGMSMLSFPKPVVP